MNTVIKIPFEYSNCFHFSNIVALISLPISNNVKIMYQLPSRMLLHNLQSPKHEDLYLVSLPQYKL